MVLNRHLWKPKAINHQFSSLSSRYRSHPNLIRRSAKITDPITQQSRWLAQAILWSSEKQQIKGFEDQWLALTSNRLKIIGWSITRCSRDTLPSLKDQCRRRAISQRWAPLNYLTRSFWVSKSPTLVSFNSIIYTICLGTTQGSQPRRLTAADVWITRRKTYPQWNHPKYISNLWQKTW